MMVILANFQSSTATSRKSSCWSQPLSNMSRKWKLKVVAIFKTCVLQISESVFADRRLWIDVIDCICESELDHSHTCHRCLWKNFSKIKPEFLELGVNMDFADEVLPVRLIKINTINIRIMGTRNANIFISNFSKKNFWARHRLLIALIFSSTF